MIFIRHAPGKRDRFGIEAHQLEPSRCAECTGLPRTHKLPEPNMRHGSRSRRVVATLRDRYDYGMEARRGFLLSSTRPAGTDPRLCARHARAFNHTPDFDRD